MTHDALPTQSATFSLLQLALPAKPVVNVGIFLLDPATDRLYMKLRSDWCAVADPDNREVLEQLGPDFEAKIREVGGDAFLRDLEDILSNSLLIINREPVQVSGFKPALDRLFE